MVFGRKLVGKLDYLQNFNDYLLKCSVGKLLISCSVLERTSQRRYVETSRRGDVVDFCMVDPTSRRGDVAT